MMSISKMLKSSVQGAIFSFVIFSANNIAAATELTTSDSKFGQAFTFESYPEKAIDGNSVKKPILASKLARQYKTVITLSMSEPPNFAGHYRVVQWGCGTDCRGFAIVNKLTGKTYTLPGVEYIGGVMGNDENRLDYRKDSRLFVITGVMNDEIEGKFFYLWKNEKLQLLAKTAITKQTPSD
jgi:hypothetical protein